MSPLLPEDFLDRVRADVANSLAHENASNGVRRAIEDSTEGSSGAVASDVVTRLETIVVAVGLVPERLVEIARASSGAGVESRVQRVLADIAKYWTTTDDVIPDDRGLLGYVDDAIVVHTLIDRLNRRHLDVEARELVTLVGQPDLDLRLLLSEHVDAAIMEVVEAIWDGVFAIEMIMPIHDSVPVFATVRGEGVETEAIPPLDLRGEGTATDDNDKPQSEEESARAYDVWFGTNREPVVRGDLTKGFTGRRDPTGAVHYGVCEVAVPKAHKFGSVGTAWWRRWLRLDFADDRIRLRGLRALADHDAFNADLRDALSDSEGRQVLFYLHGYNVSFEEAAIRTGQLFADLKVDGAAAFFSWPSKAEPEDYFADVERIGESEAAIADFLRGLATELDGATVHIIAHSMGNRGLARALQRIAAEAADIAGVRFGQIILAAPDVSVALFQDLARVYPSISGRTTMYVSARDRALGLSRFLQDAPRAGFTPPLTVVAGIDTVEVTQIDVTLLGHGYYAEAAPVLYDIDELLRYGSEPSRRLRIRRRGGADGVYWAIGG